MSNPAPAIAEIDARIARGEWWMTLFDALSDVGMERVRALKPARGGAFAGVVEVYCRLALAVRLAVVAAMRLDVILQGLADLRRLAPKAIVAAKVRAMAKTDDAAAARAETRDMAGAKRKARASCNDDGEGEKEEEEADPADVETPDQEALDRDVEILRDRDPEVEALERALDVDPATVDFDALPLRETVEQICAALGVTPNWSRWEAGDWTMGDPPPSPRVEGRRQDRPKPPKALAPSPAASPPNLFGPRRFTFPNIASPGSPAIPKVPDFKPRRPDTAIGLALAAQAGPSPPRKWT